MGGGGGILGQLLSERRSLALVSSKMLSIHPPAEGKVLYVYKQLVTKSFVKSFLQLKGYIYHRQVKGTASQINYGILSDAWFNYG